MKRTLPKHDALLLLTLLVALAGVIGVSRLIESQRSEALQATTEDQLYLNGATVRRVSLGFNGLAADWYWMRSLQYVGRKVLANGQSLQLDNLGALNLKLLPPLLDTATTLDPQFLEPYEYAAIVLPGIDVKEAIRITQKGIAANPSSWRLYQHLGYIHWQQQDYEAARNTYREGAKLPGAPAWMQAMQARMAAEGGSRDTAREIYQHMYEQSEDEKVKEMARRRLLQLRSFDEREGLRRLMSAYKSQTGRCPTTWTELAPALRSLRIQLDAAAAPFDPSGIAYVMLANKCDVETDPGSEVPNH
ncbi:MAG: tetratricopeptide repeat protein [Pyrinomonadaceae bacterium]